MSAGMNHKAARERLDAARAHANSIPLEKINVAQAELFETDTHWPYFERLRAEAPVHFCADSEFGPYWSVSTYDLIKQVDTSHETFSSEPTIVIDDPDEDFELPMFIAMDPPKHDEQRKVVSPVVGPRNLAALEPIIRERVCDILDSLPVGETFNWVDKVSIELTTQMLATLFDFPWEDRRKLTRWSDVATANEESGLVESEDQRRAELFECLEYFNRLWAERAASPEPGSDLISLLAHSDTTRDLPTRPMEYLGNLVLLIVGGNDTTRNSLSGGVLALNQFPGSVRQTARRSCAGSEHGVRDHPLADAAGAHAAHGSHRRRTRRKEDQGWRKSGDVVRVRQSGCGDVRQRRRLHHRSGKRPQTHRLWIRAASLHGQSGR